MLATNPIITTPKNSSSSGVRFRLFVIMRELPESGAILYCRKGGAEVTVNHCDGLWWRKITLIWCCRFLLPMLTNRTEDFRTTFCAFRETSAAGSRISPSAVVFLDAARKSDHPSARPYREGANICSDGCTYLPRP